MIILGSVTLVGCIAGACYAVMRKTAEELIDEQHPRKGLKAPAGRVSR
jgi:hypothetical protein